MVRASHAGAFENCVYCYCNTQLIIQKLATATAEDGQMSKVIRIFPFQELSCIAQEKIKSVRQYLVHSKVAQIFDRCTNTLESHFLYL